MRLLAVLVTTACDLHDPHTNGLDGQLEFTAPDRIAMSADCDVGVARDAPVVLDTASCGDDCTATIVGDGLVAVVTSLPGDFVLDVTAHEVDSSTQWRDRYVLHEVTAQSFAVVSADREPLGVAYATEVGASMPLYICAQSDATGASGTNLECLGGAIGFGAAYHQGIVQVTAPIVLPGEAPINSNSLPFAVELTGAGTESLQVTALGMTRELTLRAATPAEWTRIDFAPFDPSVANVRDITASGFVGSSVAELTIDPSSLGPHYVAAYAVLADGTGALISASRITCQPDNRVTASRANLSDMVAPWSPDGVGLWATQIDVSDHTGAWRGDATCAVSGYEALGALAVHVR
jgi:hypothetical protein